MLGMLGEPRAAEDAAEVVVVAEVTVEETERDGAAVEDGEEVDGDGGGIEEEDAGELVASELYVIS